MLSEIMLMQWKQNIRGDIVQRNNMLWIEEGDEVRVYFVDGNSIRGRVLSEATATGQCWRIIDEYNQVRYVQSFQEIVLLNKHRVEDEYV